MRGFRSTLILLVIFLGLLGYIYFYVMKQPTGPEASVEQKQKVFTVESDKIEEVLVKSATGERTLVRKISGAWEIVEPRPTRADDSEVTGMVTNLASLEIQRVVDDNPGDIVQYGLAPPRVEIGFRKAGEKDPTVIYLGDKTATGTDLYAKRPNEKRVFLVSSFLDTTFNRNTFDLRDKTILKFDRDKADNIDVVSKDQTLKLAKSGAQWNLVAPLAARADVTSAEGLVGRLQTAQMKSIAVEDVAQKDLATYGLDKPAITATVNTGSARATLALGKAADEGNLYARDMARAMVFTVEKALADDLNKKASEYRPKDIFEFRPFTATRIEIARGAVTVAFEKTKGKDGQETWRQITPARVVDSAKVDVLLSAFSGLTVEKYVDAKTKTGTDSPVATVTVKFDDGKKEERVAFGKVDKDMFAGRAGEPGAAQIAAPKFDEALKALDALK